LTPVGQRWKRMSVIILIQTKGPCYDNFSP
jgi:hypothetical protein